MEVSPNRSWIVSAFIVAAMPLNVRGDVLAHGIGTECNGRFGEPLVLHGVAPGGSVRGTVTENCRTLKFEGYGFEEE
jgi:hypothetical protein